MIGILYLFTIIATPRKRGDGAGKRDQMEREKMEREKMERERDKREWERDEREGEG